MAVNHLFFFVLEKCFGQCDSLLFRSVFEGDFNAVFLDTVRSWILSASVDNQFFQILVINFIDRFGEGEFLGHKERDTNFVGIEVGIR